VNEPIWLIDAAQKLKEVSSSSDFDLKWLIESVTGRKAPIRLEDLVLSNEQEEQLRAKVQRRLKGEPVAYILGEWEFYGIPLKVGPGVLIPRPDTEALVDQVINDFEAAKGLRFADLGSGSGCIAAALLKNLDVKMALAVEKSEKAVAYLHDNLEFAGEGVLKIIHADASAYFENSLVSTSEPLDFIVANPPYIAEGDSDLEKNVRAYEPSEALFADDAGLAIIKSWLEIARNVLKPQGRYYFEIGWKQESEVSFLVEKVENLRLIEVLKDMSGHPRVVICEKVSDHG
jgi:release factor glutamine methyltransferase